jgi:hypothetical protein
LVSYSVLHPYYVAFDPDRESTSSFHDGSLEIENSWAMDSCEALTLDFVGNDSIDKHGILSCEFHRQVWYPSKLQATFILDTHMKNMLASCLFRVGHA